jgi:hypothetical protein
MGAQDSVAALGQKGERARFIPVCVAAGLALLLAGVGAGAAEHEHAGHGIAQRGETGRVIQVVGVGASQPALASGSGEQGE